jgi:hypothetical protein
MIIIRLFSRTKLIQTKTIYQPIIITITIISVQETTIANKELIESIGIPEINVLLLILTIIE